MTVVSLDPRVNRLGLNTDDGIFVVPEKDQHETFEVFWQAKRGKPFEHAGVVHASDADAAFLYGKEQFSRRGGTCSGIKVIATKFIFTSALTDGKENAFDTVPLNYTLEKGDYEVYSLKKRGKQAVYLGQIRIENPEFSRSMLLSLKNEACMQVWVVPVNKMVGFDEEESQFWLTLPEKGYRDATGYKSNDRIQRFKSENQQ